MSRLGKFMGKPNEIEIDGEKLNIYPLTLDNMELLMDASKPETQGKAIKEIITLTLKKAVPDATDEEINNFGLQHFESLFNAIVEANGLKAGELPEYVKKHGIPITTAKKSLPERPVN